MRIVSFGMCSMLLLIVLLKLLLVVGVPYVRNEELVYSSEISTKSVLKSVTKSGEAVDVRETLLKSFKELIEGEGTADIMNLVYDPVGRTISVDYVYKYRLVNGKEKKAVLTRKARVIE